MLSALRHALSSLKVAVFLTLLATGGCTLNTDVSVGPAGLIKAAGDGQTAATSTTLPTPLGVIVVNQFGERLPDVAVSWTITTGGGTLSAASTQTDELGVASVAYTTGMTAGQAVIQASLPGGILVVAFLVTVT